MPKKKKYFRKKIKARTLNMKYKMILTLVLFIITIFFNIFYTKGNPTPKKEIYFS